MTSNIYSEIPKKAHLAVNLLYAVLALGVIRAVINIIRHSDVRSVGFIHFGHALVFAGSGYLIYMISKRHNWARIALLVILAVDIPIATLPMFDSISHSLLTSLIGLIQGTIFITAMALLYSHESRAWFDHNQTPHDKNDV